MNTAPISNLFESTETSQVVQTTKNKTPNEIQQEFLKSCEDIWKSRNLSNSFNKGVLLGSSDNKDFNFDIFLKRVLKLIEEYVKEQYSDKNLPLNEVQDVFNIFKADCNILKTSLGKNSINLNNEELIAIFHGFISSFVLQQKEQ